MTRLSPNVTAHRHDALLELRSDNPPLNLLSAPVRQGLAAGLRLAHETEGIEAVVLTCAGDSGWSGADIREFGQPMAPPDLPELIAMVMQSPVPVIAALAGRVLGGGFELALACASRIAGPRAAFGLPEIRLGLIPGCGGLSMVTRLAGTAAALDLGLSGREIGAEEALALGLVDALVPGDLLEAAAHVARSPGIDRKPVAPDPQAVERWRAGPGRKLAGQHAVAEALALIEAAAAAPDAPFLPATLSVFARLESGWQSQALRHLFAAERKVRDPGFSRAEVAAPPVELVGIAGAGTMGAGIATAVLMAGLPVILHDAVPEALARGATTIARNLEGAVARGKMTEAERDAALARLYSAPDPAELAPADLIIEAVYESMPVKRAVLQQLDAIAKPGAILASNTSFLDIDELAAATTRPGQVLGMHFFSPAHVMRLLEVVRGRATTPATIAAAMALGERLGKVAVTVGNCHGFVGNRILLRRQEAAMQLLLEGQDPYAIDRAMTGFGLPMGPFAMADLAGLDVGWDREGSAGRSVEEVLCEGGRLGRKSGSGYYDYDAQGVATPSTEAMRLIAGFRARHGHADTPPLSEPALLERLLEPMLAETVGIIEEGIVLRPSDIDVIWVHGYGWPRWRGGPAWWREHRHEAGAAV